MPKIGRLQACRLRVVRMHLHGERLLAIEKFEQQRKLALRVMPSEERRAVLNYEIVQSCPGERPVGDDALIGAVIDDLPTFGVVIAVAERLAELRPSGGRPTGIPAGSA